MTTWHIRITYWISKATSTHSEYVILTALHCNNDGRLRLKCDGTRAETRFFFRRNGRVHLNRQGRQFSRLLAAEVCASSFIVGSNAGYTMFRGGVKGTGYPLHSPVSPSLPLPCVTVCHHVSTGLYERVSMLRSTYVTYLLIVILPI